jgi:hypothetical protein
VEGISYACCLFILGNQFFSVFAGDMMTCYIITLCFFSTIMVKSLIAHCNNHKRYSRDVRKMLFFVCRHRCRGGEIDTGARITIAKQLLVASSSVKMRPNEEEEVAGFITSRFTACNISDSTAVIQQETARWIENAVLRLNLCPFAFKPIQESKLSLHVWVRQHASGFQNTDTTVRSNIRSTKGEDDHWFQELNDFILHEMIRLNSTNCTAGETSIIVVPELYPNNFRNFLSFVAQLKKYVLKRHLQQQKENYQNLRIQIAPFHPFFEFADSNTRNSTATATATATTTPSSSPYAARNLIQQSPYPMIHLLRQDDLDAALDALDGDTSKVWQRNADLMDSLEHKMGSVENVKRWIMNGSSRWHD